VTDTTGTARDPRCSATAKSGARCQGKALPGLLFCWWHEPSKAQERTAARAKGGHARHGRKIGSTGRRGGVRITCAADTLPVVADAINDLLGLEVSISRSRAIGYLAGVVCNVYETTDLTERIEGLERAQAEGRKDDAR